MASQPPSVAATPANNQAANNQAAVKLPKVPPDEQFWERYSPHHEAPLSGVGSFAVHFLIGGFLLLAGYLGWLGLGSHRPPPPVDAVRLDLGGGGGKRGGQGDSPGVGGTPQEAADVAKQDETPVPVNPEAPARPELKDPAVVAQNLLPEVARDDDMKRFIKEGNENVRALAGLNQDVQNKLRDGLRQAGEGRGGSGSGGGKGTGTGTGEGSGKGEGKGNLSVREKRMLRWTMQFDTRSGNDYLRQLHGLGAILAIPKDRGGANYWIIRDLTSRPATLLDEDISQIQRIYWIDDKPHSVQSIARALGLREVPERFVAFMPEELENQLFDMELKYRNRTEDEIEETTFKVAIIGGKYTPVVVSQREKR
jgi:hypothetical protein